MRAPMKDYYDILQVSPTAAPEVIKAAYRALIRRVHDDGDPRTRNGELAREYNEAHEVLSDAAKRRTYDLARTNRAGDEIRAEVRYRILSEIAEGAIGKTYKAEDLLDGGIVCIKECIDPNDPRKREQMERVLLRELKVMRNLRHHAIPPVLHAIRMPSGKLALVMGFMEGKTIEQWVEQLGALHPESVAWVIERTLNALWYLHAPENRVIHGDIKPQNIIANDETHTVALVDFGLAMVKPSANAKPIGWTDDYAPPEQEQRLGPLLPQSDFYSLGMTMVFMLGGSLEWVQRKEIPGYVPDLLVAFIKKLIPRDVLSRPEDAGKLFHEFRELRVQLFGRDHSGIEPMRAAH